MRLARHFALKLAGDRKILRTWFARKRRCTVLGVLNHETLTFAFISLWSALSVGKLVPAILPEFDAPAEWFYLNIYEMSS